MERRKISQIGLLQIGVWLKSCRLYEGYYPNNALPKAIYMCTCHILSIYRVHVLLHTARKCHYVLFYIYYNYIMLLNMFFIFFPTTGSDVPIIMGMPFLQSTPFLEPETTFTLQEVEMSMTLLAYWANFARTG